ncbi:PorP/SprF family type IX secretion system membrane protein [Mucilaginibacter sp. UR6-11]|uniref:PorP/SprF family type IX secretion system membrane protein n=1 Tax=Mucilaginibacter sp. UR6-11 TaxID=1435644 RepID=UPI001E4C1533|nr:PorP/SprF family type IX secretion system membrane protein [Mucilaginibacter sp. UR6-11]MCC8424744.1 PorP/SprF family type IX secretion system membrane protein [Mucilaginibacter sp. UR6-11]
MRRSTIKRLTTVLLLMAATLSSNAQLNPFQASYFQNRYLYNPATAGMSDGLNISTGYRQQWNNIPGGPKNMILAADLKPSDRVGLGLNIADDQSGLIRQTRIMGTYAYHLPLGENNQQLHFGLSFGVDDSRVNYAAIHGDVTDEQVAQYNQLKAYIDGDFGIAYTNNHLYIGSAIPNLKSAFFKTSDSRFDADRLLFVGMASYKIPLQSDDRSFVLEPLAGYRIVKGYDNIIDAGVNFTLNNYGLYMESVYHSSKSLGIAFGLDQDAYAINLAYNLETGPLAQYTQGAFELGLKLRLFKKP